VTRLVSVQKYAVPVERIALGVVRLRGARYRAVLQIRPICLALAAEADQVAVLEGFCQALNAFHFELQLVVQCLPVDLDQLVGRWQSRYAGQSGPLAELAADGMTHLRTLAGQRTLLDRAHYVVIHANPPVQGGGWPWSRKPSQPEVWATVAEDLSVRCEQVAQELGRCGLECRRLGDHEIRALLYAGWNPTRARLQRLAPDEAGAALWEAA